MRSPLRVVLSVMLGLPAMTFIAPASVAGDDATVTMTDIGFDPPIITIPLGSNVIWTNTGTKVHTATSRLGPVPFDTGGIGNGQKVTINFTVPGGYQYVSATDCINPGGSPTQGFNCGFATVIVVDPSIQIRTEAPPTPTPAPAPTVLEGPPQGVTVHITRTGMSPSSATVALGGTVTWINDDVALHTVTTTGGGNAMAFDSGGLQSALGVSYTFAIQGTYTYTSAIDCLNGPRTASFDCGPYKIVVSGQPSALAPAPAATPVPGGTNPTVTISETTGFSPATLAIQAGQTVTWVNTGSQVHSVVSNAGYASQFDSGGLVAGQKFSLMFPVAGSYAYHSSTEPSYGLDAFSVTVVSFAFNGTIVVQ